MDWILIDQAQNDARLFRSNNLGFPPEYCSCPPGIDPEHSRAWIGSSVIAADMVFEKDSKS